MESRGSNNNQEYITVLEKATPEKMMSLFDSLGIGRAATYIIKVNWSMAEPGLYTDAAALDTILAALPGRKLVVEGHSMGRNDGSKFISPKNQGDETQWVREQEQRFLDEKGLTAVLQKHQCQYINVTEEYWQEKSVPIERVRLENPHLAQSEPKMTFGEFLGVVPEKLYSVRKDAVFINLARMKIPLESEEIFSLSLKNMFGLIPTVSRLDYHKQLPPAVIDINRVYQGLFDVWGVCEGINSIVLGTPKGKYEVPWSRYDLVEKAGLVVAGRPLSAVDRCAARLQGADISARSLMNLAEKAGL